MATYTLRISQGSPGGMAGNLRVNYGGMGQWSLDAPGFPVCFSGAWRGGHSEAPQGSIYSERGMRTDYFIVAGFIPLEHNFYNVDTTGEGWFVDPPFPVDGRGFTWRVTQRNP